MKIKLKLTPDAIVLLHELLEAVTTDIHAANKMQRMTLSISRDVADKFATAATKYKRDRDLFSANKKKSITLKYHEAWALEVLIRSADHLVSDNQYRVILLEKTANQINQLLS